MRIAYTSEVLAVIQFLAALIIGTIRPKGLVRIGCCDRELDQAADGYHAMSQRRAIELCS